MMSKTVIIGVFAILLFKFVHATTNILPRCEGTLNFNLSIENITSMSGPNCTFVGRHNGRSIDIMFENINVLTELSVTFEILIKTPDTVMFTTFFKKTLDWCKFLQNLQSSDSIAFMVWQNIQKSSVRNKLMDMCPIPKVKLKLCLVCLLLIF